MAEFHPPGPGHWQLDRSHYPGGTTPISQWVMERAMQDGLGRVFAEVGVPARHIRARFVHGFMYTRLVPLVGGDREPRKPPPAPVLRLLARLHPELRRRERLATAMLEKSPASDVARRWSDELGPALRATNRDFQAVDLGALDDDALQAHIRDLLDHLAAQYELHFWLHGHDLGPLSRYVYDAIRWGLDPTEALDALAGASPTTSKPVETLVALRRQVEEAGATVKSLDDVRSVSDESRALLDEYLAEHGSHVVTGYDLTALTLLELPQLIVDSILSAEPVDHVDHEPIAAALRERVPAEDREQFDKVLAEAREVMDMRDNQGPVTVEWPCGLLRRALLEAGGRLAERGALTEREHALELTHHEARRVFGLGVDGATIAERSRRRLADADLDPPDGLGAPEPEPPADALPGALGDVVAIVRVAMGYLGMDTPTSTPDPLVGVGIGTEPYVGRARCTSSPEEAIESMEPGDVLVVRATTPAFNAVLAVAGAVVTADGGPMSHAAVLARELGIAGVIGAPGALDITDGATVEVDPVTGRVTVLPD